MGWFVLAVLALGLAAALPAQESAPFTYVYDEAGRLVGVVDATGNTTTYTYDLLGNIVSIGRASTGVRILEFTPNVGPASTRVTILGAGFGPTTAQNSVTFNGVAATVLSAAANRLLVVVPGGATTGPIRVTSPAGSAVSATPFTVGSTAPLISTFAPTIGAAGSTVTIAGANFDPAPAGNRVAFNSHAAALSSATTTTLASVVPATATSGRISVATPNGRATSAADFFVPPAPYTAAQVEVTARMAIGETRTLTIGQAGKIALVVFDSGPGQAVAIHVVLGPGLVGGACDSISLRRADGSYAVPSTAVCGSPAFVDPQVLPAGTHLIALDPGGNTTGSVTLTLYGVPPDATASLVQGGAPVTVTTTTPGQNIAATFSGVAGQRVSLSATFGAGLYPPSLCNAVSLRNPNGTALISRTLECAASYFSDVLVLPATGVYTATVDPGGANVGSATLRVYNVPPDATAAIATGGSPVVTTTTVPGQNARVSFTGTAGQRVSLKVAFGAGLYPASCNRVSVQKPDGSSLISPTLECGATYFSDVQVLPASGAYVVTVNPAGLAVGSATLTLYNVPPDPAFSLVPGGPAVTWAITAPGQNLKANFNGTTGQRVALKVSFGAGLYPAMCNYVSISNPNGTALVARKIECASSYFSDVLTLPATGVYTFTLDPGGWSVGSATLVLYNVPADATRTITVNGPAAGVTVTTPGQNAVVTFGGLAGQRVTVRMTGNTLGYVGVTLRKPDGSTQTSASVSSSSSNLTTQTLPVAGTYTIVVNPSGANTGSINVSATSP